jgi:hypothetical protein
MCESGPWQYLKRPNRQNELTSNNFIGPESEKSRPTDLSCTVPSFQSLIVVWKGLSARTKHGQWFKRATFWVKCLSVHSWRFPNRSIIPNSRHIKGSWKHFFGSRKDRPPSRSCLQCVNCKQITKNCRTIYLVIDHASSSSSGWNLISSTTWHLISTTTIISDTMISIT